MIPTTSTVNGPPPSQDDFDNQSTISTSYSYTTSYSSLHSHARRLQRGISRDQIEKAKQEGRVEKTISKKTKQPAWKITHNGLVVILSKDKKKEVTVYNEGQGQPIARQRAIDFYNNILCPAIEGKTLEQFKKLFNRRFFFGMDFNEWPPKKPILMEASRLGRLDIVQYLIEELGFDVDVVQSEKKNHCLHHACHYGHYELAKYILQKSQAEWILVVNNSNETPIETLMNSTKWKDETKREEVKALIEKAMVGELWDGESLTESFDNLSVSDGLIEFGVDSGEWIVGEWKGEEDESLAKERELPVEIVASDLQESENKNVTKD